MFEDDAADETDPPADIDAAPAWEGGRAGWDDCADGKPVDGGGCDGMYDGGIRLKRDLLSASSLRRPFTPELLP